MEYSTASRFHDSLAQFADYDDYLDSKVMPVDLVYLKVSNFRFKLSNCFSKLGPVGRDLDSLFRHFKFRPSYPRPKTYYTIIFLWDLHKRKQLFNSGCINKTKSHFPMKNSHLAGVDSVPAKSADNTNNDFFYDVYFQLLNCGRWTHKVVTP